MWQKKWSWAEGLSLVAGLALVGLSLQLSIGPVPRAAFAYPINVLWAGILILSILGYSLFVWLRRRRGTGEQAFFTGQVATLSSIGALLVVLVLMGFTKQIPTTMSHELTNPIHRIGLSSILSTWYFLLLYVYMLYVLGCTTMKRLMTLRLTMRDFAFVMNHLGLFIALLFGLIAAADMQRYRMQVTADSQYPEWRGINEDSNQLEDLP